MTATLSTLIDYSPRDPYAGFRLDRGQTALTVTQAQAEIRRHRRRADAIHAYPTTDRDGTDMHVVYVHYGPTHWDNVLTLADIYEIPTQALED